MASVPIDLGPSGDVKIAIVCISTMYTCVVIIGYDVSENMYLPAADGSAAVYNGGPGDSLVA